MFQIVGLVQDLSGTPVADVEVKITGGGRAFTAQSGEFTIDLGPKFRPGQLLNIRIDGYYIISPHQGQSPAPDRDPIIVVVTSQDNWKAFAETKSLRKRAAAITNTSK
jgi:hypothetical protein